MDVEALTEQLSRYAVDMGGEVTWDPLEADGRLIWLTRGDLPNIGVVAVQSLNEVQILCADFTFDGVPVEAVQEFVEQLAAGEAELTPQGMILKKVVLRVRAAGTTYEAARSWGAGMDGWEQRLADKSS